jgi:hypothetical protein
MKAAQSVLVWPALRRLPLSCNSASRPCPAPAPLFPASSAAGNILCTASSSSAFRVLSNAEMSFSRYYRPSLKAGIDIQLANAYNEGNWATVIRLAEKRLKSLKDPYYEAWSPLPSW